MSDRRLHSYFRGQSPGFKWSDYLRQPHLLQKVEEAIPTAPTPPTASMPQVYSTSPFLGEYSGGNVQPPVQPTAPEEESQSSSSTPSYLRSNPRLVTDFDLPQALESIDQNLENQLEYVSQPQNLEPSVPTWDEQEQMDDGWETIEIDLHGQVESHRYKLFEPEYPTNIAEDIKIIREIGYVIDYPKGMLGMGLYGVVYQGYFTMNSGGTDLPYVANFENADHSRRFAVKIIDVNKALTKRHKEYFEIEKYILTKIDNKNIVKIHSIIDMGERKVETYVDSPDKRYLSSDRIYIFMDYADGGTLAVWLVNNCNTWIPSIRISLIRDLFSGMRHLYHEKILHGDVHDGNVLLFTEENQLVAKWTDFGMSKVAAGREVSQISDEYFIYESQRDVIKMLKVFEGILRDRKIHFETTEETTQLNEINQMVQKKNFISIEDLFNEFRHILE